MSKKVAEARSSEAEHCFDVAGASGSIPLAPTKIVLLYERLVIYDNISILENKVAIWY